MYKFILIHQLATATAMPSGPSLREDQEKGNQSAASLESKESSLHRGATINLLRNLAVQSGKKEHEGP